MKTTSKKMADQLGKKLMRACIFPIDLCVYAILRTWLQVPITKANGIALLTAFLFTLVTQYALPLRGKAESVRSIGKRMLPFLGRCMIPVFVEYFGLPAVCSIWGIWDVLGKLLLILMSAFLLNACLPAVLKKEHKEFSQEDRKQRRRYIILGSAIPALTMLIAYGWVGVYPFGDRGVVIVDSLHQYLPFFTDMHEKLVHGETMQYSFSGGFGYNMWAAYAYYLASPFNYLMTLVPMEHVIDFMAYSILFKIAVSGGAFAWYLTEKERRVSFLTVPFSCMYALSTFMIGYYFNLMWLDSIMVLPFLMYGIEAIIDGKGGRFYGLVLAYGIFCNYYIGYMLCLFSVLYFLTLSAARKHASWKLFLRASLRFAWYSLLAGGMAAVVLLPTLFNLMLTEAAGGSFPTRIKFYVNELEQISRHFFLVEPITIYDNQSGVNVYCGVIVLILVILYLLDREIRIAERISKMVLLLLVGISMNLNVLNFIWHGFHTQNGLPNRFAFLYIALLLTMCYEALRDIRRQSTVRIAIAWIVPILLVAAAMLKEIGGYGWEVYLSTLLLLVFYGVVLLVLESVRNQRALKHLPILLATVMTLEMMVSGVYGVGKNGTVSRSSYVNDQLVYQKLMARTDTGDSFFRSEIDSRRMRNENMFMGAKGIIMFSSTLPEATVNLCKSIGMEARTNKNGYLGVTKLFNDIFGIRYIVSKTDSEKLYHMKQIDREDHLQLYENEEALSLGFMVSKDLKNWNISEGEPMDVQRMFAALATGLPFSYTLRESYSLEEGPTYIVRLHPGEQTYLQMTENIKNLTVKTPQGEKNYDNYTKNLFDLGSVEVDGDESKANLILTLEEGKTNPVKVRIYTCKDEEYREVRDKLAECQLTDIYEEGNLVTGKISAKNDGMLFLTVPYDQGWRVSVDGNETETYAVGEAFTGLDLDAGEHEIVMEYTPAGFWEGTAISMLCIVLYLVSYFLEMKKRIAKGEI